MARHIITVCVVCLLCADQLPCQMHTRLFVAAAVDVAVASDPAVAAAASYTEEKLNARVYQRTLPLDEMSEAAAGTAATSRRHHERHKRHAGHDHGGGGEEGPARRPEITSVFLERIFAEYGQGDGTITIEDFQRILKDLGMHQLLVQKLSGTPALGVSGNQNGSDEQTCIDDRALVHYIQPEHQHHHDVDSDDLHDAANSANCSTDDPNSLCARGIATSSNKQERHVHMGHEQDNKAGNYTMSMEDMLHVCPVLLYHLASPSPEKRAGCIEQSLLDELDSHEKVKIGQDIMHVWIYAFISVFACGILGLVGVAIIPFMESRYYKHIIQYLVSLAVGTMTGDALLHLLPHSLAGQSESNMVFKGLTCMSGIVFFYMTEHGLTMISEWRKRIAKQESTKPSRAKVVRDPESSMNNSMAGDKLCKSKYSSYPYCYDEIAMGTKNDVHLPVAGSAAGSQKGGGHGHQHGGGGGDNIFNVASKRNGKSDAEGTETATVQSLLASSCKHNHHHHHGDHQHGGQQQPQPNTLTDSNTISTDLDGNSLGGGEEMANASAINAVAPLNGRGDAAAASMPPPDTTAVTVILREHESSHHGHSHKHGHVHSPPESLSAVAWMIIMGDGLHNFTDGMAIGAAFAENISGGFSTSLAVFCHELPHELGDFAILIKAGMSVRSAVYYNLLTGVLSFIGMIFGIVFGQSPEVAQWMFAAAAGLFIYIALVDMMPELSSSHKSLMQFVLQIFGMCTGVFLMLMIAIYEGDLLQVFGSGGSSAAAATTSFSSTTTTTTGTTTGT